VWGSTAVWGSTSRSAAENVLVSIYGEN
jgi:hypothetical protein